MSGEEALGRELAIAVKEHVKEELAPLRQRIEQLETENIGLRAEFRLLKELALSYRDDKHAAGLTFPGENLLRRAEH
jgi:hypothetical protein